MNELKPLMTLTDLKREELPALVDLLWQCRTVEIPMLINIPNGLVFSMWEKRQGELIVELDRGGQVYARTKIDLIDLPEKDLKERLIKWIEKNGLNYKRSWST